MATPQSLSPAPLWSLGDFTAKKLIDDDFSTGKATFKFKATGQNGGVANYKGTLDLAKSWAPNQESKFQFPYKSYYFWFATRRDQTKVHVDLGQHKVIKEQNFFANAQFYNSSSKSTIRLGSVYQGTKCLSHARLEWLNQDKVNFLIRAQVKHNNWLYVIAEQFCLTQKSWDRLDFLVGYQAKDYDVFFRHLTNQIPSIPFFSNVGVGRLILDGVYRKNGNQFGFEVEYEPTDKYKVFLAAATKQKGVDYKAKIDVLAKTVGVSAKGKFNDKFSWAVATQVPVDGSKPKQTGLFPLPIGFTLETTV